MLSWPALYRFREFAPIEKVYYDIEKKTIKGLRFPSVYGPAPDFIYTHEQLLPERYEFMCKRLEKHAKLIAVAFVNSAYFMSMYTDHVEGCNLDGDDAVMVSGYYDYSAMQDKPYVMVGFERTYCLALGAFIPPARIFYDPEMDKIYYKGEWIKFENGQPAEFKSKALYKELIQQKNRDGVVYTATGEHIFMK